MAEIKRWREEIKGRGRKRTRLLNHWPKPAAKLADLRKSLFEHGREGEESESMPRRRRIEYDNAVLH